ncbi:MAG: MFS transporter [Ilumatobacteraceae bacterium]
MRVWSSAHAIDDFYQGLVPAAVPYFVVERHYSYLGASGLALAATLGSALPQVGVGILADRRPLRWLCPTGLAIAGIAAGLTGIAPTYTLVWLLLLVSGIGVAMFHPPAGRDARRAAGTSTTAMSYFAAGGSAGFFIAPALVTPALETWGVGATVIFIPPAVLMAYILSRHQTRIDHYRHAPNAPIGTDQPRLFAVLTAVEITRSCVEWGLNTFISLYWIQHLGASTALGGVALTLLLGGAVVGALAGGRIADRIGLVRTVQLGNALLLPGIVALVLCNDKYAALPIAFVLGAIANLPFAVLVKLGQDYLPNRPGTAAGVTLGLAVSAGGAFMPVLGLVADHHGTQSALAILGALPILAIALSIPLREPTNQETRHVALPALNPTESNGRS